MFIFLLSLAIVSFICLCFFKKKFWENRYLVLLISGGVALVATLTTNFAIRGKLETKVETIWEKPIQKFLINDSLVVDSSLVSINEDLTFNDHLVTQNDSTVSKQYTTILIHESKTLRRVGYYENNKQKYKYLKDVYIVPSTSDTIAYFMKKRLYYDQKPNKWIDKKSLPYIKTIKCFYIPPSEYAMIPDSLIRELPF